MSRKPANKFAFYPVSILLFFVAISFGEFNFAHAAEKNIEQKVVNALLISANCIRFDQNMVASRAKISSTTKRNSNSASLTKPVFNRRLTSNPNKKKLRQMRVGVQTKKNVAEIEIIETENPENWSNVSSFLRNTSAVNLKTADEFYLKAANNAKGFSETS